MTIWKGNNSPNVSSLSAVEVCLLIIKQSIHKLRCAQNTSTTRSSPTVSPSRHFIHNSAPTNDNRHLSFHSCYCRNHRFLTHAEIPSSRPQETPLNQYNVKPAMMATLRWYSVRIDPQNNDEVKGRHRGPWSHDNGPAVTHGFVWMYGVIECERQRDTNNPVCLLTQSPDSH